MSPRDSAPCYDQQGQLRRKDQGYGREEATQRRGGGKQELWRREAQYPRQDQYKHQHNAGYRQLERRNPAYGDQTNANMTWRPAKREQPERQISSQRQNPNLSTVGKNNHITYNYKRTEEHKHSANKYVHKETFTFTVTSSFPVMDLTRVPPFPTRGDRY